MTMPTTSARRSWGSFEHSWLAWIGASSSKKPLLGDISNKCDVCYLKTTFRDHLKKHNDKEHNELELYSTKIDLLK